jgi:drug/metabolite transporter (DMT)-like permease
MLPIFSVLGGVLFLGETLGPGTLTGGAVVLVGVGLIVLDGLPNRRQGAKNSL